MPIRLTQTPTRGSDCAWQLHAPWLADKTGETLDDRHGCPSMEQSGISDLPEFQRLFPDDAAYAAYLTA